MKYYVLWITKKGCKIWSGPYNTLTDAERSTPMRDKTSGAFIILERDAP